MFGKFLLLAFAGLFIFVQNCDARRIPTGLELSEDDYLYTFDDFVVDFEREYLNDVDECTFRQTIFEKNLQIILSHNRQYIMSRKTTDYSQKDDENTNSVVNGNGNDFNQMAMRQAAFERNLKQGYNRQLKQQEKVSYLLGINQFIDRLPEELPRGYDRMKSSQVRSSSTVVNTVAHTTSVSRRLQNKREERENMFLNALGGKLLDVSELPKEVNWRMKGVTTPVKNQGGCGSCWAFASTAVLESHIAIQTQNHILFELSEQQLVSCASNPQHCGGVGGCAGATAEIAYEHVRLHGMVEEWGFGYQDYHGADVNCSLTLKDSGGNKTFYHGAVITIKDYAVLPSNNYTALMNAVARLGPVAVSVACLPWQFYSSGVFHAPLNPGKATDIDHLVVLEGYGTDQESGEDYWLVRNSWSPMWGEGGYIRLKRVDEYECGMDNTPEDGDACTFDDEGNPVTPTPQLICGNSGILFDSVIPLGGMLV